jgi:hypothetical protein
MHPPFRLTPTAAAARALCQSIRLGPPWLARYLMAYDRGYRP